MGETLFIFQTILSFGHSFWDTLIVAKLFSSIVDKAAASYQWNCGLNLKPRYFEISALELPEWLNISSEKDYDHPSF